MPTNTSSFWSDLSDWFRIVTTLRYPLSFLALLTFLAPLCLFGPCRRLAANAFFVDNSVQFATLTLASLAAATLAITHIEVVLFNANYQFVNWPNRIDVASWELVEPRFRLWSWSLLPTITLIVAGLAIPVNSAIFSWSERGSLATPLWKDAAAIVVGVGLYVALIGVMSFAQDAYLRHSRRIDGFLPSDGWRASSQPASPVTKSRLAERSAQSADRSLGLLQGFVEATDDGPRLFRPGQWQLTISIGLLLFVYVLIAGMRYFESESLLPERLANAFNPVFYVILLLMFAFGTLSFLAYALDRYHWPPLLVASLTFAFIWILNAKDHAFQVRRVAPAVSRNGNDHPARPASLDCLPTMNTVLGDRALNDGKTPWDDAPSSDRAGQELWRIPLDNEKKRTLVVVTAPGGGIHAAAWTATVLAELDRELGPKFARSLKFISAVSGGSVGAMHYVQNYPRSEEPPKDDEAARKLVAQTVRAAATSSLEAIGYSLAYDELWGWTGLTSQSRGVALERSISKAAFAQGPAPTLRTWADDAARGKRPFVVFNTTSATTGRRVLFPTGHFLSNSNSPDNLDAVEFISESNELDVDVEIPTAVRMSATFPYVSPAARSSIDDSQYALANVGHLVDGGYADNEGILTVMNLLNQLRDHKFKIPAANGDPDKRPFDRILIVRIRHSRNPAAAPQPSPPSVFRGLWYALFGPLQAVANVRTASQSDRAEVELALVQSRRGDNAQEIAELEPRRPDSHFRHASYIGPAKNPPGDPAKRLNRALEKQLSRTPKGPLPLKQLIKEQKSAIPPAQAAPENPAPNPNPVEDGGGIPVALLADDLEIDSVVLDYRDPPRKDDPQGKDVDSPLTWKLTPKQIHNYGDAWRYLKERLTKHQSPTEYGDADGWKQLMHRFGPPETTPSNAAPPIPAAPQERAP